MILKSALEAAAVELDYADPRALDYAQEGIVRAAVVATLRAAANRMRNECQHGPSVYCLARADDLDRWAQEITLGAEDVIDTGRRRTPREICELMGHPSWKDCPEHGPASKRR